MLYFVLWLLINALGVYLTAALLPGAALRGFGTAVLVVLVLALVNALVRPVLVFLTLPLTILTLGLFLLVINGLMVMLVAALLDGFQVQGFWWALLFAVVLVLINMVLFSLVGEGDRG
jgi:putative membrane protein